jgi:hypothetical protein
MGCGMLYKEVRGGRAGPVRALCGLVRGARGPGGVIAQDFGLRGILTANKLPEFRVSELGSGAAGTIRAERAHTRAEVWRGRSFQRTLLNKLQNA